MKSFKKLKGVILDNLKAKEFFMSDIFRQHFSGIVKMVSGRYGNEKMMVKTIWGGKEIARTDNRNILVNLNNELISSVEDMETRYLCCIGLLGHELGHVLYTDFDSFASSAEEGRDNYIGLNSETKRVMDEIFDYRNNGFNDFISQIYHYINNSIEDGFVNRKISEAFPGTFKSGIKKVQDLQFKDKVRVIDSAIVNAQNIILCLSLKKPVSDELKNSIDCYNKLEMILKDIDSCETPEDRISLTNNCLVTIWHYIKEILDIVKSMPPSDGEQGNNQGDGQKGQASNDKPSSNSGSQNEDNQSGSNGSSSQILKTIISEMKESSSTGKGKGILNKDKKISESNNKNNSSVDNKKSDSSEKAKEDIPQKEESGNNKSNSSETKDNSANSNEETEAQSSESKNAVSENEKDNNSDKNGSSLSEKGNNAENNEAEAENGNKTDNGENSDNQDFDSEGESEDSSNTGSNDDSDNIENSSDMSAENKDRLDEDSDAGDFESLSDKTDGNNELTDNSESNDASGQVEDTNQIEFPGSTGIRDENVISALEELLAKYAQKYIENNPEQVEKLTLETNAKEISKGSNSPHYGYPYKVINISGSNKTGYETAARNLSGISKRLQKRVEQILEDQNEGGVCKNLLKGNKVNPAASASSNGKIFKRNILPESKDIAISLLIDESGSMSGTRIQKALEMAIIIEDFCRGLGVPLSIVGHCDSSGVCLRNYIRFEDENANRKYNLSEMRAGGCNRDGFALRYCINNLLEREEENKLMIIISDGRPNSNYYSGEMAEKDLQEIKKEFERKGGRLIAAAIGSDKDTIKRIYGNSFLDVTDINKLPLKMASLISRYVQD